MNKYLVIGCIVLGIALAALTLYFLFPKPCPNPVTCDSDKQCGGTIVSDKFCKDSNVYGNGQTNTCVKKDRCTAVCETSYSQFLVEKCKNGCVDGACT